ncbi:hypothetical protein [Burkholderia sp. JKS000303]|uniref:hypothetical protein n=1 Tax=Burkholderia sp. JKS000303 TaxID=1938747 RepID=UPI000C019643|nr:hypothetical protein [Burkholderia sp. JKS000303]PFH29085.1 hypothetical protein BX604_2857 [Burkholderia sp. JKS000303]
MTTTDKSCADALKDAVWRLKRDLERGNVGAGTSLVYMADLRILIEAVEQHEAAPAEPEPPLSVGDRLTRKKAAHIIARDGFYATGYVLGGGMADGRRCIVEMGAVRWLTTDEAWKLMHPDEQPAPSAPLEGTGIGADELEACVWLVEWQPNVSDKTWVQSFVNELDAINKHRQVGGKLIACARIDALSRAPRTEVAGAVPAYDKPCTCHPDDRVEPCAKQYAASECKRAQHEPQVADDNTTWPVISKNIALHALQARMAASQSTSDSHEWDDVGERCIKCGDKDWMADPVCRSATPAAAAPSDERDVIEPLTEPVSIAKAMLGGMRARVGGNGESTTAFLVNIQIASWGYPMEWVKGCVFGFNRAAKWMQSALLEYQSAQAASQPAAAAGQEAAIVRDNPDDIGTIIEATRPLEIGMKLYTAPPAQVATRQGLTDEQRKLIEAAAECISEAVTYEQDSFDLPPQPASQWDYNADQLAYALRGILKGENHAD